MIGFMESLNLVTLHPINETIIDWNDGFGPKHD